jgi:hypothetical protein
MKYPEYKFVDAAIGGVEKRNNVIETTSLLDAIKKNNAEEDYKTVFRFPQLYFDRFTALGTVSGYDGECYTDSIPIDIDNENLQIALETTQKLITKLQNEYEVNPDNLKYFFSGKKGFHIEIPINMLGEIEPSRELHKHIKRFVKSLSNGYKIDEAIYDKNRLFRIENTKHRVSGLYKIPLMYSDIVFNSTDKILEMAKQPRDLKIEHNGNITVNEKLAELFNKSKEEISNKPVYERKEQAVCEVVYPKEEKYCVWKILQEGARSGSRNDCVVRIVAYYKKKGHSEDVIRSIVLDWNAKGQDPAPESDITSRVADCYKASYDYGCNDHILSSYHSKECGFHKRKKSGGESSSVLGNVKEKKNRYVEKGLNCEIPISNFVIRPQLYIITDEGHYIEANIIGDTGNTAILTLPPEIWSSKQRFTEFIDQLRWTQFNGGGNSVQYIKGLVCQKTDIPEKKGIKVLGEHDGMFLIGKKVITKDGYLDNAPIVYLPRSGQSSDISNKINYVHLEETEYRQLIHSIYSSILNINTPEVTIPNIGWWFATPFSPRIMKTEQQFPALSVFGSPGCGKTTLQKLLARLFGMEPDLYSATEKPFVLLYLTSSTNAIPVILDEYKPWKMSQEKLDNLHRILRLNYNGSIEGRGRPDQTIVSYAITAPLAIVGEGSFSEEALLERIIPCCPKKGTLKNNSYTKACNSLNGLVLNGFVDRYISWTLRQDFSQLWKEAVEILNSHLTKQVTPRIRHNLTVMVFGIRAFERYGQEWGIDLPSDIGLDNAIENCINLLMGEKDTVTSPLDYFIEKLSVMANNGKIKYGDHYYVQDRKLYIHFASCYGEFRKYAREANLEGEVLHEAEYKRLFRDNIENKGYIESSSESTNWGSFGYKRALIVDKDKVETLFDMSGFDYGIILKAQN